MVVNRKLWLTILITLIISSITIFYLLSLYQSFQVKPKLAATIKPVTADLLQDINLKLPGAVKDSYWDLYVTRTENEAGYARIFNINGKYFCEGKEVYQLTAVSGKIHWDSQILVVNGGVRLTSVDGKEIQAGEISWDSKQQKITADQLVTYKDQSMVASTEKFITDHQFNKGRFFGLTKIKYLEVKQ